MPAPSYPIERLTLPNGLRVVIAPDRSAPVVGVSVHYDVGFRSEPTNRTGFAHLFEHLMFQGSENVGKAEHPKYVQAAGGTFNGSTHPDYTNYFQMLPSGALELALFLEADRMRAPKLTQENLENQIAVVQEEIRVNVMNRPYGGFPWIRLPDVAYTTFPNAHNGYGAFEELQAASLADAASFFDAYYAPGNAVLTVTGDVTVAGASALIEKHFGEVPERTVPTRPDFGEPVPTQERRKEETDPLAPQPALAVGYRVPDPVADLAAYLPYVLLTDVLTAGDASRLDKRLVQHDRLVTSVETYLGTFGDPFDQRDPLLLTLETYFPPTTSPDAVLGVVDEELDRLATDGLAPGELDRVRARLSARLFREVDDVLGRTLSMAVFELLHADPSLINTLPQRLADVTAEQLTAAAAALRIQPRSLLMLQPPAADGGAAAKPAKAGAKDGGAKSGAAKSGKSAGRSTRSGKKASR
jgi:predicted Zn-dependent peptidase